MFMSIELRIATEYFFFTKAKLIVEELDEKVK